MKSLKSNRPFLIILICTFLLMANQSHATQYAENFRLLDQNGESHELYYYDDFKGVVLIWQQNGNADFRKSVDYLNRLKQKYEPLGIKFFMVNAHTDQDRFAIREELEQYGVNLPVLQDTSQMITRSLGARFVLEALLLNTEDWHIVFRGEAVESDKNKGLEKAIEEFVSGKTLSNPQGSLKGEKIIFQEDKKYTYVDDIVPVLREKCLSCHSEGGMAPWSMDSYQTVKGWGPMIREVVRTNRMPPLSPDPYYGRGEFQDDYSLTTEDMRKIIQWIEAGMPKEKDEDPLVGFKSFDSNGWALGQPDMVLSMKEDQFIEATGVFPYRYIELDHVFENDVWLRAVELKPGNPRSVHHIIAMAIGADDTDHYGPKDPTKKRDQHKFIGGYVSGRRPIAFSKNAGRFISKGSRILFEMHYVATGKPETDNSQYGLYFLNSNDPQLLKHVFIENGRFRIPPGEKDYRVTAEHTFDKSVRIDRLIPHMHYRGKDMKFTAYYPDGSFEVLLSVPNYRYDWQHQYAYRTPKRLLAGTKILVEGHFDNSAQNRKNPDPSKEIGYGRQSWQEMFVGIVAYVELEADQMPQ